MTDTKIKQMEYLIGCSNDMLKHAEAGDWKNVAVAEEYRRKLLNTLFANPPTSNGVPEINKTIQNIITINKKLEGLAIEARNKTRVELENIKEGRQAVKSYTQYV